MEYPSCTRTRIFGAQTTKYVSRRASFEASNAMATKRDGGLNFTSGSLRQSLGPPVRMEVAAAAGRVGVGQAKRKSRPPLPEPSKPGGYRASRYSAAEGGQNRRPLSSQQQRRQTQVLGSSRISSGRYK